MKTIDYNDWIPFGKGGQAKTYKSKEDDSVILRIVLNASMEAVENEFNQCRHVASLGINTPAVYELVTDGKHYGYTGQLIKGKKSLCRIIADNPERTEEIAELMAQRAYELHSTECDTEYFGSMKERTYNALQNNKYISARVRDNALKLLDEIPDTTTCLLGDFHFGNIITTKDEQFWIDLGEFSYGNPVIDFARFMMSFYLPNIAIKNLFHIDRAQLIKFYNALLDSYCKLCGNAESFRQDVEKMNTIILTSASHMPFTILIFTPELQKRLGVKQDSRLSLLFKLILGRKPLFE